MGPGLGWIVIGALLVGMVTEAGATPPTTRAAFARAAGTIKPGMTADQVTTILGPPDDIKTERDPGGISAARTTEIWRYGTRGHLAFATLGAVHLQADRKVQYVFGGDRTPPSRAVLALPEATLRPLLEALAAVPSYNARFDPRPLIAAVDALQPRGKDEALAVVDEFLRVSSWLDDPGREGVFLVMRALFDVNTGKPPEMMVGAPSPAPLAPAALPRFPLVIVGDLPIKLVNGYELAGMAESPETDVAAFRKVGTLRVAPLAPTAASLDALAAYVDGPLAKAFPVDDNARALIYDQALAAFATVYRPQGATVDSNFPLAGAATSAAIATRWANQRAAIAKLAPAWSATRTRFELPDGAVLPPPPANFPRVWWDLALPRSTATTKARVTLERLDDQLVAIEFRAEVAAGGKLVADRIVFVDVATQKTLGELAFTDLAAPAASTAGTVTGTRLALPRGRSIRLHTTGGIAGPVLTP